MEVDLSSPLEINGVEVWDNTKLSSYSCLERGRLAHEAHWRSKRPNEALAFGEGFHKAVEIWTKARVAEQALPDEVAVEQARAAFRQVWEKELPEDARQKLEIEGDRRSYANFQRLFAAFCRKFPIEMFDRIVATEIPFTLYLGKTPAGCEVSWSGILDRAVEWQGGLYYVDIKTTSYHLSDRFFAEFRLSGQMTGYAWAGEELGIGNFSGIMIQAVSTQTPQEGVKLKKDGTPYARQGKQVDDLIGCEILPVSGWRIEEWKRDTLQKIDDVRAARARGHWPKNWGEICNSFGGCAFRSVCEASPEARAAQIEQWYEKRVWNPLER